MYKWHLIIAEGNYSNAAVCLLKPFFLFLQWVMMLSLLICVHELKWEGSQKWNSRPKPQINVRINGHINGHFKTWVPNCGHPHLKTLSQSSNQSNGPNQEMPTFGKMGICIWTLFGRMFGSWILFGLVIKYVKVRLGVLVRSLFHFHIYLFIHVYIYIDA